MGYLVQKTRVASLTIGGTDYTSDLISFQVSDSSAFKNGLMTTSGTVVLGQRPGTLYADAEDYDRNRFKRGTVVTLDVTNPGTGIAYRHPRGYLYVMSASYDVEKEQAIIEVGCQLALAYLTDNTEQILPLVPIPLDPAQETIENCSASFASAGKVLYQNNQGNLQTVKFFGSDSSAGVEGGEWVSVLGQTALSVQPLTTANPVPDEIHLSYSVPVVGAGEDTILATEDQTGKTEKTVETSSYFLNYPATVWVRESDPVPTGENAIPVTVTPEQTAPPSTTACGNSPTPPLLQPLELGIETESFFLCTDEWTTEREAIYLPAERVATSETVYGAPGAQVSYVEQTVKGPELEANPSYFADRYAFCVSVYGDVCNPSGSCPYYGLDTHVLSKQITYNRYASESNELIETIQDNYETLLSAARTEDYRSGIENGVPLVFNDSLSASDGLYRRSRVVTQYYKENNWNVQLTTTYSSITSRGIGISRVSLSELDALNGIVTTVKRKSTTTATVDIRPDLLNTPTTAVQEESTDLVLTRRTNGSGYVTPPSESGPYILEESVPSVLLSTDSAKIAGWVADYSEYLARFVNGSAYGLQIAESMRSDIVTGWQPGMPFRYADRANNKILAMRMDACVWGVTQEEALVVTDGVWIGFDTGTLSTGDNLEGNSSPNMDTDNPGADPTPPSGPSSPPSIIDSDVPQDFQLIVDVNLWLNSSVFTYFPDGISDPNPTDMSGLVETTTVPYVTGFVVAAGTLLSTDATGSIPVSYGGSLIVSSAQPSDVINNNLFA